MFLKELLGQEKKEYVFREQTIIWKNERNEYIFYISVILETHGWNRFDYSAFDYGDIPFNRDIDVMVYSLQMKEKKIILDENKYLLDDLIWYPEYKKYKTKFSNAF